MNYQDLSAYAYNQNADHWAVKYKTEVDAKNALILAERQQFLDARKDIDVGDLVWDGQKTLRVAHDWGDSVQLTDGRFGGSFYLGDGYVNFSGGLDPSIPKTNFLATKLTEEAPVWFFSENWCRAHNGWHTQARFRVWLLVHDTAKAA